MTVVGVSNKIMDINKKVIDLWTKSNYDNMRAPTVYGNLEKYSILFIGLNPSFSERGFKTFLKETVFKDIDVNYFFSWPLKIEQDTYITKSIKMEVLARDKYQYFKKFDITNKAPWEHIDLFFIRETNQNKVKDIITKNSELNEFGLEQLELSGALIREAEPKVIVVVNAYASKIIKERFFSNQPELDQEFGCYFYEINGKKTPVFLASMFSGQRAMDNYSYERLKWQIKRYLDHK